MKIYRGNDVEIVEIEIDRSTTINNRLMVENTLTMRVDLPHAIDLRIKDYVIISGERYELYDAPQITISKDTYSYDALFVGNLHRLDSWLLDSSSDENYFYYTTLTEHLELILRVITEKESGWSYTLNAEGIDASPKNIEYSSLSCLSSLHKLAQEYNLEFDVKLKHIAVARKIERVSSFEFAVGRGEGLYKITRGKISNSKITTRLYGLGSKMNMKAGQRLTFDEKYIERNIDLYGLREDKVVFDNIYPRHKGTLTRGAQQVEAGKVLWTVVDTTMDFDLKQQFLEDPKIVFTSGACAGLEFVITDYDNATKTITFKEHADESVTPTYVTPNANRKPEVLDTYHYINILMPDSYVINAKTELKVATVAELAKISVPIAPYIIEIDPRFVKAKGSKPINGDLVRITNDETGLDALIRIIGYTYPVINPNEIDVTVCDNILISSSAYLLREVRKEIIKSFSISKYHPLQGRVDLPLQASAVEVVDKLMSKDYTPGLTGATLSRDEWGRWLLEVDKIVARMSITVDEFVKNRVTVANNQTWFTDNGVINEVELVNGQYFITIAQDKGAASTFIIDDLLRGVILKEDKEGLYYSTILLTVVGVIEPYRLHVILNEDSPSPEAEMVLFRVGNRTNPDRQNSIFMDGARPAMFYYVNVDSHLITVDNIAQATGNLKGYNFGALTGDAPITERFSNVIRGSNYQEGFFVQKSGNGLAYPVPADRGMWVQGSYFHYDRVSHNGSIWDCAVKETTKEPAKDNTDWTEKVRKGADIDPAVLDAIKTGQKEQGNRLNDWASDKYISPTEKNSLKDQHHAAIQEKKSIDEDVVKYKITNTTSYLAYVSAIYKAIAAWSKYTAPEPENIMIEDDYTNISTFYESRANIQIAIADAVARKTVGDIEIGGVNLLPNSDFSQRLSGESNGGANTRIIDPTGYWGSNKYVHKLVASGFGNGMYDLTFQMFQGQLYSYWVFYDNNISGSVMIEGALPGVTFNVPPRKWTRIYTELNSPAAPTRYAYTPGIYYFTNLQVENGNKLTGWNKSPQDVESDYKKVADEIATTKANLVEQAANANIKETKDALQRAINALDNAKANLDDVYVKSIADNKITEAESRAINAANIYSYTTAELARVIAQSHADNIVTAEEARAIADATNKADAARVAAEEAAKKMVADVEIGGSNILRCYDGSYNLDYWKMNLHKMVINENIINGTSYLQAISSGNPSHARQHIELKPNTQYILSIDVAANKGCAISIIRPDAPLLYYVSTILPVGISKYPFKTDNNNNSFIIVAIEAYTANSSISCRVQIEEGNKGTTIKASPEDIANIKIGGVNLLPNSDFSQQLSGDSNGGVNTRIIDPTGYWGPDKYVHKLVASGFGNGMYDLTFQLLKGQLYSYWVYAETNTYGVVMIEGSFPGERFQIPSRQWTRVYTKIYNSAALTRYAAVAGTYYFTNLQVEEGDKATGWNKSPKDIQAEIEVAKNRIMPNCGEFKDNTYYYNNSTRRDVVKKGSSYYKFDSYDSIQQTWIESNWERFDSSVPNIATDYLWTPGATIANFQYGNSAMESQHTSSKGVPNLSLNGITGLIKALIGQFGVFEASENGVVITGNSGFGDKTWLTKDNITSVAQAINLGSGTGTGFTVNTAGIGVSSVGGYADTQSTFSVLFTAAEGAVININTPIIEALAFPSSNPRHLPLSRAQIFLVDQYDNEIAMIFSISQSNTFSGIINYTILQAGNYKIKCIVHAEVVRPNDGSAVSAHSRATIPPLTIAFTSNNRKHLIAPNGTAIVTNTEEYLVATGDIFETRMYNSGLKIERGGVSIMRNGAWSLL